MSLMYQLSYSSISNKGLKVEDLDAILEEAIAENSIKELSGCLVYHNNNFVQILEGKKSDVLFIYAKIENDPRHHQVRLLWENDVQERFFPEWNMAYYRPDDQDSKQFVDNLLMLSEYSEISSSAILSFWAEVSKVLRNKQVE